MLSDGMAYDSDNAKRRAIDLKSHCHRMKNEVVIHTIKFGLTTEGNKCLQDLAKIGLSAMHLAKRQI